VLLPAEAARQEDRGDTGRDGGNGQQQIGAETHHGVRRYRTGFNRAHRALPEGAIASESDRRREGRGELRPARLAGPRGGEGFAA
jgi:hypothetical protein